TERVATECGLQPIGVAHSYTASGEEIVDVFLVSVFLPNGLAIDRVRVTKHLLQGADILIGMDIIALGDFAVTNHNGKTTFSYRYPSMQEIDYVKEVEKENLKNAKKKRTGKTKRGGKRRRAW
ncbi:MAG: hypothetical protein O7H40_00285, partial [Gammaproteobacteria bacterium]|nr:hypothetical protein [Gammaproteobacteria bacterium]